MALPGIPEFRVIVIRSIDFAQLMKQRQFVVVRSNVDTSQPTNGQVELFLKRRINLKALTPELLPVPVHSRRNNLAKVSHSRSDRSRSLLRQQNFQPTSLSMIRMKHTKHATTDDQQIDFGL